MTFTDNEQRTILAVLDAVTRLPYDKQNTFMGSVTIKEARALYSRMIHAPYCEKHGIRYEDMDEFDFEAEYRERYDA